MRSGSLTRRTGNGETGRRARRPATWGDRWATVGRRLGDVCRWEVDGRRRFGSTCGRKREIRIPKESEWLLVPVAAAGKDPYRPVGCCCFYLLNLHSP